MALQTKEGYLFKYRNKLSGWENRYFRLDRMYLHYYETKDAPAPRKTVLRADIVAACESTGFPDRNNTLEISIKSTEKWHVQCSSEFDMKEWAKALLSHVPEGDKRREWLDIKIAGVPEPKIPIPQIPHYMMPPVDQAPPSYRTATNAYNQPQPPSGPYYQSGAESIPRQYDCSSGLYPTSDANTSQPGTYPSAPFYQPY